MEKGILKKISGIFTPEQQTQPPLPQTNTKHVKSTSVYKIQNPRSYERYRGKNGAKPMSYYIPDNILTALDLKSKRDAISKSDLVVEGLKYILSDELKELKLKGVIKA